MKTVILCGGRGFRLQEETEYRPKTLVTVGGKPILDHIMRIYAKFGYKWFILCLGYKGEMIKDYFVNYDTMNKDFTVQLGGQPRISFADLKTEESYRVTLSDTGLETQTAGRIKKIQRYTHKEPFMLTYGDGLADINISNLVSFHKSHGKLATMTVVHPISKYGVVKCEDDKALAFSEKPVENDWINAGFFVFQPEFFDYLDDGMLEQTPLQKLTQDGQLMLYKHEGFFHSMDTYRDYQYLNELWVKGERKWM